MRERLRVLVRKELIQALREPRMRALLIGPPIIQLIIFGYAANMDVDRARLAWMDMDHSIESRELLSSFEGSNRFVLAATPDRDAEMQKLLDRGDVDVVVRVLPGFGRDVERGRTTAVQVLVDGTDSNTASIVANYASQTIAGYSQRVVKEQQVRQLTARTLATGTAVHAAVPDLRARSRVWFNPDLLSRNYFVPGIVVNIITIVTLMLTAMAIVREREIGTMEQLMVTPIRPLELMIGKTVPFALVGLFDTVLVVSASMLVFHVPFRGSFFVLLLAVILFLWTTLGAGLFISTVSKTQQQAMMSTLLAFVPAFLLSGFAFPIRNMPAAAQYLTYINPVRYFLEIVRGIFLKGTGVAVLWPQLLALAIFGIAVLTFSALRFHKKLD
jgi:ABC-2 type transport system permease protein